MRLNQLLRLDGRPMIFFAQPLEQCGFLVGSEFGGATTGIPWNQSLQPISVPAFLPVVARLTGNPNRLCRFDDTHALIPQLNKHQARDHFRQSLVMLDLFLQSGHGNVSDNRDLFTSSHAGMGGSRFKRVSPGTIIGNIYRIVEIILDNHSRESVIQTSSIIWDLVGKTEQ